jgi:hypothetical protein
MSSPDQSREPEAILHALAAGEENLGERLLRLARMAASCHRAAALDLLMDEPSAVQPLPHPDLNRLQAPAPRLGEREQRSPHGCEISLAPVVRRKEVA